MTTGESAETSTTTSQLETPLPTSSTASAWLIPEQNSSTTSPLLAQLVTHVGEIFSAATTEAGVEEQHSEEDPDPDGQRRQLLIGIICLAVVLVLVLVAVGYFFYRVSHKQTVNLLLLPCEL